MSGFEVTCNCGYPLRGARKSRARVLTCPQCSERRFIFPRSVLPTVTGDAPPGTERPLWQLLVGAAVCTTLLVITGLTLFFLYLPNDRPSGKTPNDKGTGKTSPGTVASQLQQLIATGNKNLQNGSFELAVENLKKAEALDHRVPNVLSRLNRAQMKLSLQQAELFADLIQQPLEGLIREAQNRSPEEWKARFQKYRNGSVLWYDVIEPLGKGRFRLQNHRILVGEKNLKLARVELPLELLTQLELEQPRPMIVGARLESIAQEEGGQWVIRFQPQSAVLMTDEKALHSYGFVPADQEGLREVLRWQREQMEQLWTREE